MKISPSLAKLLFLPLALICCLTPLRSNAQIISNGTDIGPLATTMTLTPGTLLINPAGVISNASSSGSSQALSARSSGTYAITNNGLITNSGTTDAHQAVAFSGNSQNYKFDNHGVVAINPTSIYEAIRSIGGTGNTGTINNWGTIRGDNSGALVNFSGGTYTFNNYSNLLGSIAAYSGPSITFNQFSGIITKIARTNAPYAFRSGASNTVINLYGGRMVGEVRLYGATSTVTLMSNGLIEGPLLYANNNSTNSIFISGGDLQGNVSFGGSLGTITFNRADNYTYSNVISGNGTLVQAGTGTTTLSSVNTFTRGTTVSNGTLSVASAKGLANNASNVVTVANGGTFSLEATDVFGRHTDQILTPIVINGGTVTNGGAFYNALGSVEMNGGTLATAGPGVNGYSLSLKGAVTVNSNSTISGPGITLGAGGINSTTFNVASGVALTINGGLLDGPGEAWPTSQPSSLAKSGTGSLVLNGANTYTGGTTISDGTVAVTGSGVLNNGNYDGNIALSAAGSKLVIDTTQNQSLGGIISGAGSLVKSSAGTLTVTGSDNSYTGATTIGGGTLALNGTHTGGGAYTVQSGATLKGDGRTTAAVTVDSGGNITPGHSPGELTIGDFTLNGTLNISIDGDSTSLLAVVGNANVTAGTVSFTTGAAATEDVYVFLSASGTLSSPFTSINGLAPTDPLGLAGYELFYDANDGVAFLKLNSVTNVAEAIFPGPNAVIGSGTTNFNVYVYNGGTNTLSAAAAGDGINSFGTIASTNIAANSGNELSSLTFSNGAGTFGTNTAAFNAVLNGTTNATTFDVVVYNHASNVVTGTNLNFLAVHAGAGTVTSTNSVTVSNKNDSFRIALGVTNDNANAGISVGSANGLAQGDSADLFATLDTSTVAPGRFTNTANLISFDDSDLNGASTNLGMVGVQITGYVYTGQGVWTGNGGDWQDFADWQESGGTPGLDGNLSVNDTAFFGAAGNGPVTLNTAAELLSVTFSNATTPYVLSGTGTLALTASGANPAAINTLAGGHTISNAVAPGSDLVLSNASGSSLTLAGAVSGVNGLVKTGAGTTTMTANNTYAGATTVAAGKLVVEGSIASSAVTAQNGGTLAGSGTVGGLIVSSGGTVSPGNSLGDLNVVGDMTWSGGGNYNWQALGTTATPGAAAGTTWDLITVTGTLDLSALSVGSKFNINLWSLASTGPDVNGNITNFNATTSYEWLAVAAGSISGFDAAHFAVNVGAINGTGGFSNPLDGGYIFGVRENGGNLYVTYGPTPIPEPGTWAVMVIFAGGAAYAGWRRRQRTKVS